MAHLSDEAKAAAREYCQEIRHLAREVCEVIPAEPPIESGYIEERLALMQETLDRIKRVMLGDPVEWTERRFMRQIKSASEEFMAAYHRGI